jgi:hypothetical protein
MPDGQNAHSHIRGRLIVVLGRQRVGKTTVMNACVQYCRALGGQIEVWNADQQNRTHTLSTFFADAAEPPAGGLADVQGWIEEQLSGLVRQGGNVALDAGGGLTGFSNLASEVPIVGTLEDLGIKIVALFCVGPEQADLDYLDQFAHADGLLPEATAIILNSGLVLSGRSSGGAFAAVRANGALRRAAGRGAKVFTFPGLPCMSEVTDRGIAFADAAVGLVKPGQDPMQLFDPVRVHRWWTKEIPTFFGKFPPGWLPIDAPVPTGAMVDA